MDSTIATRINEALSMREMSQAELCRKTGIASASISSYCNGRYEPKGDKLHAIAKALRVSPEWLLGKTDNPRRAPSRAAIDAGVATKMGAVRIPVVSEIAAGTPIEAMENAIDDDDPSTWEEIPKEWLSGDRQYVALRVTGDSMEPDIPDGTIAIIERCYEWRDGKIMAVYVNGYTATLKRVRLKDGGIVALEPLNKEYQVKIFTPEEVEKLPVRPYGVLRQTRTEW